MEKITIDKTLALTDQGIYDGDIQILSLVIDGVEVIHDQTDAGWTPSPDGQADGQTLDHSGSIDADPPKVTCRYTLKNADTAMDVPFTCSYDPEDPQAFLKELEKKAGICPRPKDKPLVLSALRKVLRYLTQRPVTPGDPIPIKHTHISNRSGWHHINRQWLYPTSEFAITKDGIDGNWHCTTPNAYLYYYKDMTARDAYLQILDLLELSFAPAAPILASAILSLLGPLRKMIKQRPIPSLLISGLTDSGKTQLATYLARMLTEKDGDLERVFILQGTLKDLRQAIYGLSDTTVILDDIRRAASGTVNDRIKSVAEPLVRDSFSSGHFYPVLTGESDSLARIPSSLRNRWIDVLLDPDPKASNDRKVLITQLHERQLLVRTFFRHFIQFLASYFENVEKGADFPDPEERFKHIFPYPRIHSRLYDNLQVSYWAFDLFLEYGEHLQAISSDDAEQLSCRYADILTQISERQSILDPSSQTISIFLALIRRMDIHEAIAKDYIGYPIHQSPCIQHYSDTYGHHAVIDLDQGYSGVFIEDTSKLAKYPGGYPQRTLLVVNHKDLKSFFLNFSEMCKETGSIFLCRSFDDFKAGLRDMGILLGRSRHDPDHPEYLDYMIKGYPCYNGEGIRHTSVLVFKLDGALAEKVRDQCDRACDMDGRGQDYLCGIKFHSQDIEACAECLAPLIVPPKRL